MPDIQPDFQTLRDQIDSATWQVIVQRPDGVIYSPEIDPRSKEAAYDAAQEAYGDGCAVEVTCVHRNTWGAGQIGVSDYSAMFHSERGLDPDRTPITAPGYDSQCDDRFDDWRGAAE